MLEQPTLVVIGTGQLARSISYSLAVAHADPLRVLVVGRRAEAASEVCHIAAFRAAVAGRGAIVRFEPAVASVTGRAARDLVDLGDVLGAAAPAGVLLCASTQSPWERLTAPSAWTELVRRAGFGVTLPFQAEHALAVGAAMPPGAWFVNACFPDAVNPLLAARGVPVLCGVGNVGLLAASLQAALDLPDQRRLQVLAHHVHLNPPASADEEALAWCDGEPLAEVGKLLAAQRAASRPELNQVTGLTAARLAGALLSKSLLSESLLSESPLDTSLPGPLGLPGGYPVRVRAGGGLELRLPAGLTMADAVARNRRWALADGATLDPGGDRVVLSDTAGAELDAVAPELAGGFRLADLEAVTARLHELRDRLRGRPCPS